MFLEPVKTKKITVRKIMPIITSKPISFLTLIKTVSDISKPRILLGGNNKEKYKVFFEHNNLDKKIKSLMSFSVKKNSVIVRSFKVNENLENNFTVPYELSISDQISQTFLPDYWVLRILASSSGINPFDIARVLTQFSNLLRSGSYNEIHCVSFRLKKVFLKDLNKYGYVIDYY